MPRIASLLDGQRVPPGVVGPAGWLLPLVKDQRVAFLLVGVTNTLAGGLWFALIDTAVGYAWHGWGHYLALVLTYLASIVTAFVLYRSLVFRVHGHVARDLIRFSTVYASAFVANVLLFAILHNGLGMAPIWAQVVNIIITTVISFLLHRNYSFRRPPAAGSL